MRSAPAAGCGSTSTTFPELRDWLLDAGFEQVDGYSGRGEEFTVETPRMVLVATA